MEIPTVTVIGKRSLKKEPARSSELTGESIEREDDHEVSLSTLLRQSPAVVIRQTGGEGTPPEFLIRGLDPIQNRYFLEGVPLTDAAYNNANAELVPLEAVSGIDLYAEGIPVYLAEDGLGGAVQLKLASSALDHGACPGSAVDARGGSFGYTRVAGNGCTRELPANVHLSYLQSSEDFLYYDDNGTPFNPSDDSFGRRTNNAFRRFTALPEARLLDSPSQKIKLFSLNVYGEKEIPGSLDQPAHGKLSQWYHLTGLHHTADLGGGWSSDSQLYWHFDSEKLDNLDPLESTFLPTQSTDAGAGLRASMKRAEPGFLWEVVTGAAWEGFKINALSAPSDSAWKSRAAVPFGISSSFAPLGETLTVKPAVLGHFYYYEATQQAAKSYALASPRLGIVSRPARPVQLRATIGSYYRAPTLFELYGSPAGISAAPGLQYERAAKMDTGVDLEFPKPIQWLRAARLSYTFSASRASDLITYVQNSQQTRVAVNVGQSEILGHELAMEVKSVWDVGARAAVTFLQTRNLSDIAAQYGKDLPHRPPYQADVTITYARSRWSVGYELAAYGPMYWDLASTKLMGSVVNHNIRASWDSRGWGSFAIEMDNLTDVISSPSSVGAFQTIDNSTGYFGYPAPGRRCYLSWHYDL